MKYHEFIKKILGPDADKDIEECRENLKNYISTHKVEMERDGILRLLDILGSGGIPVKKFMKKTDLETAELVGELAFLSLLQLTREVHKEAVEGN